MSGIESIGGSQPVHQITPKPAAAQPAAAADRPAIADRLELSGVSHLLAKLKSDDVRVDKVREIKAQIEAGAYETDEKLDTAIERLLDELAE